MQEFNKQRERSFLSREKGMEKARERRDVIVI
jgi:hypothetical protein